MRGVIAGLGLALLMGCDNDPTSPPPPRPLARTAVPPPAAGPVDAGPPAPEVERFSLVWKLAQGERVAFQLRERKMGPQEAELTLDVAALAAAKPLTEALLQRLTSLPVPAEQSLLVLLERPADGPLQARLLGPGADPPKAKPVPTKRGTKRPPPKAPEPSRRAELVVRARGTLESSGFVASDLPRATRNVFAMLLELPAREVAVGDHWKVSVDLVRPEPDLVATQEDAVNDVTLRSVELDQNGERIAIVEAVVAEHIEGTRPAAEGKPGHASSSAAYVSRGEFSIDAGRWRRLAVKLATHVQGHETQNEELEQVLTPLPSVPPAALTAQ